MRYPSEGEEEGVESGGNESEGEEGGEESGGNVSEEG